MPYIELDPATAAAAPATTAGNPLTSVGETLSSLQSTLLEELSSRADATTTRMTRWINFAYRQLCGMIDLPELWADVTFSFVASQPLYLLPAAVAWSKKFVVVDTETYGDTVGGITLRPIDYELYRTLDVLTDEPRMFFIYRRMAVLYPTPLNARSAVMDFRVRPASLANPTDSPIIPQEFHEGLMLLAKARAFRQFRLYPEAAVAMNDALGVIRPLINTAAEENANVPSTMTPMSDDPFATQFYRGARW